MPRTPRDTRVALPYLHDWRTHRLLSMDELARQAGVTKPTLVRLEHGSLANLQTVGKLANGLGITREQLVYQQPDGDRSSMQ